jgi:phage/plasmid-associated DNA primase
MCETSLDTFSKLNDLTIKSIEYFIDEVGKKIPVGEKNNLDKKDITRHAIITHALRSYHRGRHEDMELEFIPTESIFLKHTDKLYVIDVDEKDITSMADFEQTIETKMFSNLTWTKGNTKGIHIYAKIEGVPNYTDQQDIFKDFSGDFLRKNNVWEKIGKVVYGNPVIQTIPFNVIEYLFKPNRFDIQKTLVEHPEKKEVLDFVKKAIDNGLFTKMKGNTNWDICGKSLASICGEDGRQLFLDLSKSNSPDVFNEERVTHIYSEHLVKATNQRKQVTKGLLISVCFKTDKKLTSMILNGKEIVEEKKVEIDWEKFSKDEREYLSYCLINKDVSRAEIVKKQLENRLVYYSKNIYALYNEETKLWETEDNRNLLNFITYKTVPMIQLLQTKCIELGLDKKRLNQIGETIDCFLSTTSRRNLLNELESLTFNPNLLEKINKAKNMLPLKNGLIFDISGNSVIDRNMTDLFDFEMPVAYTPNDKEGLEKAETYFLSLFCGRKDTMQVFLNYIKTAMTGNQLRYFITMLGDGRNGKSLVLIILGLIFGKFIGVLSKDIFITRKNESNINTEVFKLTQYRFGYASELKETDELNSKRIKEITGGDPINYRGLHQADTTIKPTCNIGACSQFMPSFNTQDQATIDRLICFPFNARFDVNAEFEIELKKNISGIFTYIMINGKIQTSYDSKKGEITDEIISTLKDCVSDNVTDYLEDFMEKFYEKTELKTSADGLSEEFQSGNRDLSQKRGYLYETYVTYCRESKFREQDYVMKASAFTKRLTKSGFEHIISSGSTWILVREKKRDIEK